MRRRLALRFNDFFVVDKCNNGIIQIVIFSSIFLIFYLNEVHAMEEVCVTA